MDQIFASLLAKQFGISDEDRDDYEQWVEEAAAAFICARAYADMAAWLREAKGPNAAVFAGVGKQMHREALIYLRNLGQKAFMLWGVNIPLPKGLKQPE